MVIVKTAPYGEWKSQIGAEAATAGSRSLSSPRVCVSLHVWNPQTNAHKSRAARDKENVFPRVTHQRHKRDRGSDAGRPATCSPREIRRRYNRVRVWWARVYASVRGSIAHHL